MKAHQKWHSYKTKELMWDADSTDEEYYGYLAFFDMAEIVFGRA